MGAPARVAPSLMGRFIRHGPVVVRITEVEAYAGPEDSASHARFGRTVRTAPMWAEAGLAYVYLCYGVHWMLNVVIGEEGRAGAVLIRAAEVVVGQPVVEARRGGRRGLDLLAGPGRVAQGLDVSGTE